MVNRGASRGCLTCRQRRVKCDEAKPLCKTCLRLGRECTGYGKKAAPVRFRDETARYTGQPPGRESPSRESRIGDKDSKHISSTIEMTTKMRASPSSGSSHGSAIAIPSSPQPPARDLAFSFFLTYVTDVGRSLESSRGFLEFVRPVLATQRQDSALHAAINAISMQVWVMLGHSPPDLLPKELLSEALVRLRKAVEDPEEKKRDATVLAAMVLHLLNTLLAISGQNTAHGTHREGALALLLSRDSKTGDTKYHGSLLGNLLHSRVSLCIRERIPFSSSEVQWLKTEVIPAVPTNLSSLLDVIGISVANLQYMLFERGSLSEDDQLPFQIDDFSQCIRDVDMQLEKWLEAVPQHWYPNMLKSGKDFDSSINTYKGACHVYPSVQIATIWNVWRTYKLILLQSKVQLERDTLALSHSEESAVQGCDCGNDYERSASDIREAQQIVDDICHSVPFYLGNRKKPAPLLSHLEDSKIVFPSYHDLDPEDDTFLKYHASDYYVPRSDHSRHVILHGSLHIMSILAHVVDLGKNVPGVSILQDIPREQKCWIVDQFVRAHALSRLGSYKPSKTCSSSDTKEQSNAHPVERTVQSKGQPAGNKGIEAISTAIKQELWTMSVL